MPVRLEVSKPKSSKNAALPSTKSRKESSDTKSVVPPALLAKEIEGTLSTAQINLTPSTTTAVKVGLASFTSEQLASNVEAVMASLTDRLIAWRNVRSVHVKGPNTMALPVWLADELWTDEGMILEDDEIEEARLKESKGKKKRKAIGGLREETIGRDTDGKKRKGIDGLENESRSKKAKRLEDEDFSRAMKERRAKLRQQKSEARESIKQEIAGDSQ